MGTFAGMVEQLKWPVSWTWWIWMAFWRPLGNFSFFLLVALQLSCFYSLEGVQAKDTIAPSLVSFFPFFRAKSAPWFSGELRVTGIWMQIAYCSGWIWISLKNWAQTEFILVQCSLAAKIAKNPLFYVCSQQADVNLLHYAVFPSLLRVDNQSSCGFSGEIKNLRLLF